LKATHIYFVIFRLIPPLFISQESVIFQALQAICSKGPCRGGDLMRGAV